MTTEHADALVEAMARERCLIGWYDFKRKEHMRTCQEAVERGIFDPENPQSEEEEICWSCRAKEILENRSKSLLCLCAHPEGDHVRTRLHPKLEIYSHHCRTCLAEGKSPRIESKSPYHIFKPDRTVKGQD